MLSKILTHAVVRLVDIDMECVASTGWIGNNPRSYIACCFRQNFELLRTSRKLVVHMSPRLVRAPLEELNQVELQILRDMLQTSRFELELERSRVETVECKCG
jgi:hypothetical protein